MRLVAVLGLLILTMGVIQVHRSSLGSRRELVRRESLQPVSMRFVSSLGQQPAESIDYDELQMVLSVIGSGGYTTSKFHAENDLDQLETRLKPALQKMLLVEETALHSLVLDILTCRGGEEGFLFRPLFDQMEDKPNLSGLPVMRYRFNALVVSCPADSDRSFELGLLLYDVDLILKLPVSEEAEKKCLAVEDPRKRDACFFENHRPEDKFSKPRMDNLNRFMVYTALKETKRFVDSFKQ